MMQPSSQLKNADLPGRKRDTFEGSRKELGKIDGITLGYSFALSLERQCLWKFHKTYAKMWLLKHPIWCGAHHTQPEKSVKLSPLGMPFQLFFFSSRNTSTQKSNH